MQVLRPAILVDDDEDDQEFIHQIFKDLRIENELKSFTEGSTFLAYLTIHIRYTPSRSLRHKYESVYKWTRGADSDSK